MVVLGLIVGGVLVGKDLIKAAEIRKVISQTDAIKTAIYTFRAKYNYFPGDIPNATMYWLDCLDVNAQDTCNGDGNGNIGTTSASVANYEPFRLWQHLSFTHLISNIEYNPSELILHPSSVSPSAYYSVQDFTPFGKPIKIGLTLSGITGNLALDMRPNTIDRSLATNYGQGVLTGKDAYSIDKKIDDGFAYFGTNIGGKVFGIQGCIEYDGAYNCSAIYTDNCAVGGEYDMTSAEKNCTLNFSME